MNEIKELVQIFQREVLGINDFSELRKGKKYNVIKPSKHSEPGRSRSIRGNSMY